MLIYIYYKICLELIKYLKKLINLSKHPLNPLTCIFPQLSVYQSLVNNNISDQNYKSTDKNKEAVSSFPTERQKLHSL